MTDVNTILLATRFAATQHQNQRRSDAAASPYINHPIAVAALLTEAGVSDPDLLVAALLHDTIEDTETTRQQISDLFGQRVLDLVLEVTDDKSLPKQTRKQLQIENAPHKSNAAKQLKIADKICNIRDMTGDSPADWDVDRKLQYIDWAVEVVNGCRDTNAWLETLFDKEVANARQRVNS